MSPGNRTMQRGTNHELSSNIYRESGREARRCSCGDDDDGNYDDDNRRLLKKNEVVVHNDINEIAKLTEQKLSYPCPACGEIVKPEYVIADGKQHIFFKATYERFKEVGRYLVWEKRWSWKSRGPWPAGSDLVTDDFFVITADKGSRCLSCQEKLKKGVPENV